MPIKPIPAPECRLIKPGEFPSAEWLKKEGYRPAGEMQTGPINLMTFEKHTTPEKRNDLSHWTIAHDESGKPVAALHLAPNGSEVRMVPGGSSAVFNFHIGSNEWRSVGPGQVHEMPPDKFQYRDRIWIDVPPGPQLTDRELASLTAMLGHGFSFGKASQIGAFGPHVNRFDNAIMLQKPRK